MASDHAAVTVLQFLDALFPDPQGFVTLVEAVRSADNVYFVDQNAATYDDTRLPGQLYYCISTCSSASPRSRKPSRKHPELSYVLALDDIGTKVPLDKMPPGLRPTYALETSPQNFHVGYRFKDPVTPARAAALISGLASAGFTDPGASGAVRLMRVPGSLNGKPQHGDWRARLTTWNPEVQHSYSELALAFKVTPTDTPALSSGGPQLEEGQRDSMAEWTMVHHGQRGGASGPAIRGHIPLICPQSDQHTVGVERANDSSTVWIPGSPGAFHCTHAHCVNFRTKDYLAWIRANYTDVPVYGLSVDLKRLGQALASAMGAQAHTPSVFTRPPQDLVREAVLGDLVKVGQEDRYYSLKGAAFFTRAAIDDQWSEVMNSVGLLDALTPSGRPTVIAPHIWLRRQPDVVRAAKLVHRLGQPIICEGDLNIAPAIPAVPFSEGEPTPWLELLEHIANGDDTLVDHLIDWFSMLVGCWTEKPGWHLMLQGDPGTGKNLLTAPIRQWLGPHHVRIEVSAIGDKYHPFLSKKFITVDELRMTTRGATSMHDVYSALKAWTTRGNFTVDINDKYTRMYTALDLSAWSLSSNEVIPMPMDEGDRRFLVIEPPPKRPIKFYDDVRAWGDAGGWDQVVGWLARQWAAMDAGQLYALRGTAPMTTAKTDLIEGSAEGILGAVKALTRGTQGITAPELTTAGDVMENLRTGRASDLLPDVYRRQLSLQRVAQAMRSSGWIKLFHGKQIEWGTTRLRLWCRSAQRALLYEQMGAGKRLVESYQQMKSGLITSLDTGHTPTGELSRVIDLDSSPGSDRSEAGSDRSEA